MKIVVATRLEEGAIKYAAIDLCAVTKQNNCDRLLKAIEGYIEHEEVFLDPTRCREITSGIVVLKPSTVREVIRLLRPASEKDHRVAAAIHILLNQT